MIMQSGNKINSLILELDFVFRNFCKTFNMTKVTSFTTNGILYRGMSSSDEPQVLRLYFALNNGARLSLLRRWLYRFVGNKLILLAIVQDKDGDSVIGMNMYYLNQRDIVDETIHEGFIGVSPSLAGRGIASNLRKIAMTHFAANGFKGISSRISLDNQASLSSGQKLGFQPVEKYYDSAMAKERYYLICNLEHKNK